MTRAPSVSETLIVYVPFRIVKRGGRKVMTLPTTATDQRTPDYTFVKALARAFRWKQLLDSGAFATITDLAEREKISTTYLARIIRLTLLAPDLVEKALEGRQSAELFKAAQQSDFPIEWAAQRSLSLDEDSAR